MAEGNVELSEVARDILKPRKGGKEMRPNWIIIPEEELQPWFLEKAPKETVFIGSSSSPKREPLPHSSYLQDKELIERHMKLKGKGVKRF